MATPDRLRHAWPLLALLLVAGCRGDQSSGLALELQRVVSAGPPGAVVLVREGGRTRTAAAGLANEQTRVQMRADDRFRVGSVTKTFVATVVLQLVAEGQLGLDEPVSRWLPGLLRDGELITIRQLLGHRSGLADVADEPTVLHGSRSTWSPRRLVALMARRPRTARPGTSYRYSSTNYLVLGLVIEHVTGRSVASELARRIIEPLGLGDTAYTPGPIRGRHVHGYSLPSHQGIVDPKAEPRDLEARSARWAGAAGDLVSSAPDLARFLHALLTGKLVPGAQLRAMEALRPDYGLGLAAYRTPCGRAWGHTGSLNGVLTIAWSTRDGRRQAIVAANAYPLTPAGSAALRRAAFTAFCGR